MKDFLSKLETDPLDYLVSSKSPIGIYLRKEVLKKEAEDDDALKKELYTETVAGQSDDGSWERLFVYTANNLWNLALLGYDAGDSSVEKGLSWIRSLQKYHYHGYPGFFGSGNRKEARTMRSTFYGEFVPGCTNFYQTTYAVHLLLTFGFGNSEEARTAVESYLRLWGDKDWQCGLQCGSNVLRVLIEHPMSRESKQVENGLRFLHRSQTKTGSWKHNRQNFPFYHTFHALSRSSHILAKEQLEKALPSVVRRQNKDGSWGRSEDKKETLTYLVLDAFKNASYI